MRLYPDSKVYIFCPGNVQTGGPESCHQLASALISLGVRAYLVYFPINSSFNNDNPVHEAYKKYHVPYVFEAEDNPRNIVVNSEANNWKLYLYKKAQRIIWWISVDNYFGNIISMSQFHMKKPFTAPIPRFFTFHDADKNIEHWGQSEYVRQFLRLNGVKKIQTVETHMSQTFLSRAAHIDLRRKKNFVAYNPKKGFEITRQLMEFAPDIDWRPIQNMTPEQVQNLLAEAKIYIDFGEFPGRERLPREAILSGCVVITGKRGAAANDIDINIPAEFKFDMQATLQDIVKKIREVFENFDCALDKQKAFRDKELNAQKNFTSQVVEAFKINKVYRGGHYCLKGFVPKVFCLPKNFCIAESSRKFLSLMM